MIPEITILAMTLTTALPAAKPKSWLEPPFGAFADVTYGQPVLETLGPTVTNAHVNPGRTQMLSPSEIISGSSTISFVNSNDIALIQHIFLSNELCEKIDDFAGLPTEWAGNDTVLPSSKTRLLAKKILKGLSSDNALPQVTPSAEGEIGFVWYGQDRRVEVLLGPDDHLVWFGEFAGITESGGDIVWAGIIPDGLLDMIERAQA
jgi:hypothetical protein